jgi:glycosyltransferase involved in cell wall biosynthesis
MPLADTDWTRGKCSFKMLQYMATALPVVVSPFGMNAEVLTKGAVGLGATSEDEWYHHLSQLFENRDLCIAMGKLGRQVVQSTYSAEIVVKRLAEIIKEVA